MSLKDITDQFELIRTLEADPSGPSYLDYLVFYDVIDALRSLLETGWRIDEKTKKLTATTAVDWTRNWIFTNPDKKRLCDVYQNIFASRGIITDPCLGCWKVVVKMDTLAQLLEMLAWQTIFTKDVHGRDRFCKCGIEEREYVTYPYGAYFYCNSQEQGLQRVEEVGAMMAASRILSPLLEYRDDAGRTTRLILKRYCTEFELKAGPSDQYVKRPDQKLLEDRILSFIDRKKENVMQPREVVEHVILNWLKFAWSRGDMTVKALNHGGPLYTPTVPYHPAERGGEST